MSVSHCVCICWLGTLLTLLVQCPERQIQYCVYIIHNLYCCRRRRRHHHCRALNVIQINNVGAHEHALRSSAIYAIEFLFLSCDNGFRNQVIIRKIRSTAVIRTDFRNLWTPSHSLSMRVWFNMTQKKNQHQQQQPPPPSFHPFALHWIANIFQLLDEWKYSVLHHGNTHSKYTQIVYGFQTCIVCCYAIRCCACTVSWSLGAVLFCCCWWNVCLYTFKHEN